MPELRALHGKPWFRLSLHAVLILAFTLSLISLVLRTNKVLGATGIGCAVLASLLGGAQATQMMDDPTPLFLGLDFFVLNIVFTGFLFVPVERLLPKHPEQALFRAEWREDLFYYLVSSLAVQLLTFLSFLPAETMREAMEAESFRAQVAGLPLWIQIPAIMFLTDLVQYWVHRLFHTVPWLWKFHAVHHSARTMDWMAGARMHFLEILVLRSTTVIPMIVLGFSSTAVGSYVFLVYLYSTFVHANFGPSLRWIDRVLVTPRFHHWHHGLEEEAIDVNFAIHFPLFDRLFGTFHMPGERWPEGYGVGGHPVPKGYWAQFRYPFQKPAESGQAHETH